MFDARLLPLQHRLLEPVARMLAHAGAKADAITLAGFAIGIAAVPLIAAGHPLAGWKRTVMVDLPVIHNP